MVNGEWWFTAREGEQGPYPSREAADQNAHRYAQMMHTTDQQEMEMEMEIAISNVPGTIDGSSNAPLPTSRPSSSTPSSDNGRLLDSLFRD